jgi:two-component system response regulator (stage 0 sporulation protein F)
MNDLQAHAIPLALLCKGCTAGERLAPQSARPVREEGKRLCAEIAVGPHRLQEGNGLERRLAAGRSASRRLLTSMPAGLVLAWALRDARHDQQLRRERISPFLSPPLKTRDLVDEGVMCGCRQGTPHMFFPCRSRSPSEPERAAMAHTLLVAEDDPALRRLYSQELRREGYQVVTSMNGPATIQKVKESQPDLVVLDIRMPGIDGIEVMSRILEENPELPIIINTAFASYRESFLSWSADAYLIKCSDLSELKATIRSVLERRRQPQGELEMAAS